MSREVGLVIIIVLKLGPSYCRSIVDILTRKNKVERKDLRISKVMSLYKVC